MYVCMYVFMHCMYETFLLCDMMQSSMRALLPCLFSNAMYSYIHVCKKVFKKCMYAWVFLLHWLIHAQKYLSVCIWLDAMYLCTFFKSLMNSSEDVMERVSPSWPNIYTYIHILVTWLIRTLKKNAGRQPKAYWKMTRALSNSLHLSSNRAKFNNSFSVRSYGVCMYVCMYV